MTSFTNLVGKGYPTVPAVEDKLAAHLSPNSTPSWMSRPLLPSKPCRTTSAFIGKSYMAAGQAGAALHTMAILQAYQAEALKEMDEGCGVTPEAVKELRRGTDLALRATKHTEWVVGRSMAGLVRAERHLWRSRRRRRLSSSTPRSPALACSATRLMPSSINSELLKRSQLRLTSSCHNMCASQPLPHPPGNARAPVRSQSVGWASRCIPHLTRFGEPAVIPFLANAP